MVTVRVNRARLLHEMACRGWHASDLAREARLSEATVSHLMRGRSVSPHTLRKVARAFTRSLPVPGLDVLVETEAA